jgi:hypothetical protein
MDYRMDYPVDYRMDYRMDYPVDCGVDYRMDCVMCRLRLPAAFVQVGFRHNRASSDLRHLYETRLELSCLAKSATLAAGQGFKVLKLGNLTSRKKQKALLNLNQFARILKPRCKNKMESSLRKISELT